MIPLVALLQARPEPADSLRHPGAVALAAGIGLAVLLLLWIWRRARRDGGSGRDRSSGDSEPVRRRSDAELSSPGEHTIFISYRRDDSAYAVGRLYDRLADRFGKEAVFKDVDSIPLGVDFRQYLSDRLQGARVLLAVIGSGWLDPGSEVGERRIDDRRDFVRIELESGLELGIPIIPVFVDRHADLEADLLPESLSGLAHRQGVRLRSDPDFQHDVGRLIQGIEELLRDG